MIIINRSTDGHCLTHWCSTQWVKWCIHTVG